MSSLLLPISGVILAGGKSRRMGQNKALLPIGGKRVFVSLLELFYELFDDVFIVTNQPELYESYCSNMVPDLYVGKGPLAGIHSALVHTDQKWIFVSACDTPFICERVVREMGKFRDYFHAVIAETEEGLQPLNAFYSRQCIPAIESCLESDRLKVTSFLPDIKVRMVSSEEISVWDPSFRNFWNMNTPEDYKIALNTSEARLPKKANEGMTS